MVSFSSPLPSVVMLYVTTQPLLKSFLPSFKRGTLTWLLEHWGTTTGFAPAGLQRSRVVVNTLGPLQSRCFPPHFKAKPWEARGCWSGTSAGTGPAKVPCACLWALWPEEPAVQGQRCRGCSAAQISTLATELSPSSVLQYFVVDRIAPRFATNCK